VKWQIQYAGYVLLQGQIFLVYLIVILRCDCVLRHHFQG